jgi:hypothetical protein
VIEFPELAEGVQAPSITFPDQAKNGREVVGENDETEPTAVNQPSGLEDLFFLLMMMSARPFVLAGMESGSFHVPRSLISKSFFAIYWMK